MDKKWYIVQTKPSAEALVEKRWQQVGYEVFLPRVKKVIRGARKPIEKTCSLFPSYLFVKLNLADGTVYNNVRYTRGVRRVLGLSQEPLPVDDCLVEVIRERVDENSILLNEPTLQKGSSIRVTHGPLQDLIGVLEKPVSAEGRVRVLIHAYHKSIRAELSSADIEAV